MSDNRELYPPFCLIDDLPVKFEKQTDGSFRAFTFSPKTKKFEETPTRLDTYFRPGSDIEMVSQSRFESRIREILDEKD